MKQKLSIDYDTATPADQAEMKTLLFQHGTNQWNHLPEEFVDHELGLLGTDQAIGIKAIHDGKIVGFALSLLKQESPKQLEKYCDPEKVMFISDVVVNTDYAGNGIGSSLLELSIQQARQKRLPEVYISRHEENLASAGMMRKAGFEVVETYHDPEKRTSGSGKSVVLKIGL